MANKIFSVPYYHTPKDFFWICLDVNNEKLHDLSKKLKFVMLNCWTHFTTTRNYAVTYYKTLEEVPWHLGLIKWQKFSKSWKLV